MVLLAIMMPSVPWPILGAVAVVLAIIPLSLVLYTMTLAIVTMLRRAKWQFAAARDGDDSDSAGAVAVVDDDGRPWSRYGTSFFRGSVFHVRHRPVVHTFKYPLHFAYVDLDESSDLFGKSCRANRPEEDESDHDDGDRRRGGRRRTTTTSHRRRRSDPRRRGSLWPLSSLMSLRDDHHLKNGEGKGGGGVGGSSNDDDADEDAGEGGGEGGTSMRDRITNLVCERTRGKLDLSATDRIPSDRRRIVLVTHLMYYGYCFNPVSFFFVLRPSIAKKKRDGVGGGGGGGEGGEEGDDDDDDDDEEEEDVEAVVVEVSNTPWNEMHVYVLHPDSIDTAEYLSYPPPRRRRAGKKGDGSPSWPNEDDDDGSGMLHSRTTTIHRYKWRKGFHVSPFMTMDHDYDWKFQVGRDRIRVEARMMRRRLLEDDRDKPATKGGGDIDATTISTTSKTKTMTMTNTTGAGGDDDDDHENDGRLLYFTAGFDVRRDVRPTYTYPLQLAVVILRYPIYCLVIQLWIHYEAVRLLIKGVEFVPHPGGSETGASRAIAAIAGPAFRAMDAVGGWWKGARGKEAGRVGKSKSA